MRQSLNHCDRKIIEVLRKNPEGLDVIDVASRTGWYPTEAKGYLDNMVKRGLIVTRERTGRLTRYSLVSDLARKHAKAIVGGKGKIIS